jgi:Tol biopolymer transport system component
MRILFRASWMSAVSLLALGAIDVAPLAQARAPQTATLDTPGRAVRRIRTVLASAGRLDWCHAIDRIVFDRVTRGGYYEVFVSDPDGRRPTCLTCGKPGLPGGHRGNPACHPSGQTIVLQASDRQQGRLASLDAWVTNPGAGFRNDLWLAGLTGERFVRLTDVGARGAVLHAHFSRDGRTLAWTERVGSGDGPLGVWAVKVGDFQVEGTRPRLANVRTYQPGSRPRFYETHGFAPDGSLLITSNSDGQEEHGYDIYRFDYRVGRATRLTDSPGVWDEHAQISPDGTKIVWMSSQGLPRGQSMRDVQAEFWIMNGDGSGKQRLTYFTDPTAPEHIATGWVVAADSAWSADGRRLIAYVKTDRRTNTGPLLSLDLR